MRTAPCRDESDLPIGQLRWNPIPIPDQPLDFLDGLRTIATCGDAALQLGMASHVYLATKSMDRKYFYNADGELLIVPQLNGLRLRTECGVLEVTPGEICVMPRGLKFAVDLLDGPARGYICENYGAYFDLPERGRSAPIAWPMRATFSIPVRPMKTSSSPASSTSNRVVSSTRPTSRSRRSTSSHGMATTRHANTICAGSRRLAPRCSITRIHRSTLC